MPESYPFDPDKLPDSLLVDLVADGDADAFAVLVRRYGGIMRAIAFRYTRNSADADDVVQEALVSAWRKIEQLQDCEALKAWLLQLTARKAIDAVRSRRSHSPLDEQVDAASNMVTPAQHALNRDSLSQLDSALAQLPVSQARAWVLRHGAQMSYHQIAQALGVSTATVRGRLARARAALIERMEEWHDAE